MPTLSPNQIDTLAAISVFGTTAGGQHLNVGIRCLAYSDDPDLRTFQATLRMAFFFEKMGQPGDVPLTRSIRELNSRTVTALEDKGMIAYKASTGYTATPAGVTALESTKGQLAVTKYQRHHALRETHGWGLEDIHYGVMSRCRCGWKKPLTKKVPYDAYIFWEAHFEDVIQQSETTAPAL